MNEMRLWGLLVLIFILMLVGAILGVGANTRVVCGHAAGTVRCESVPKIPEAARRPSRRKRKFRAPCGATESRRGNPLTEETLQRHIADCHGCQSLGFDPLGVFPTPDDPDPLGVLDDDLPDGAYFAMSREVYGDWF